MFAGSFYGNPDLMLLDYRPFDAIDDATTPAGSIIYPPETKEIVPAGTLIQIKSVIFPTASIRKNRPLYSPRNQIWLYVRIAKERGKVSIFRELDHVIIVPKSINTKEDLKGFINTLMARNDPHSWILQEQSYIQEAIWQKRAVIGMSKRDVLASLGPAEKMQAHKGQGEEDSEVWHYSHYFVVFNDERVSKVKKLGTENSLAKR
jgi:hypothetical protein